ncbi:carbon-nitrogen family hydrolase [Streptomyces scopuliridis]|uniref:Apolipoprotein N-acyltransferase n=1 Tax=Streptomyces scopuliridis RB72 TaxID=1440053 RepID=A0A2T7T513_9ACTN|nr:carbon-nitrogen family hydrolase [Streptomyces scopuliridis]PVE10255.1 apolipoprotein N- acyltransferase [Streptomyces scopuliridis RB72]
MRASLIQIAVDPDESVDSRRRRAAALVREQRGADLVVLPELWPVGAFAYESFADEAETPDGPTFREMSKAASEAGVWLHAGSIVERAQDGRAQDGRAPDGPDQDGTLYNTSLVLSPAGELVRTYRKIHRFGFDKGEATLMGAGGDLVTVRLPETTLGLATCYDLRFPELFRGLVDAGAETLVVPAGWPARRRGHWTLLARARAVENQAYVLACSTAGTHAGVEQSGHSIVVDPWGEVLAEAGTDEEVLTVDFDPGTVATTRERFPALKDRRLGLETPPANR